MTRFAPIRWIALSLALVLVPANLTACFQKSAVVTPRATLAANVATSGAEPLAFEEDVHADLVRDNMWPSARECANCHAKIYDEWSSSAHAYSGISPMFHKFEQTLNGLAIGTLGAFCVTCHLPVGTNAGQPREMSIYERATDTERFKDPYVSIEGVTCIACHRVKEQYGRVNGQRRIEKGTVFDNVYGSRAGEALDKARETGLVTSDPEAYEEGQNTPMHGTVTTMATLSKSEFCMSCHQVAVHPGIKLEVVWDQYLHSPAHTQGAQCQDCHMGKTPGKWDPDPEKNFERYPRAMVNGTEPIFLGTEQDEVLHKDHSFVGPGYSIAHPGLFPHRAEGLLFNSGKPVSVKDWMLFNVEAGWGTTDFELSLTGEEATVDFGPWTDRSDREQARDYVDENLRTLEERQIRRTEVMENGSHIDGPFFASTPRAGEALKLHYEITNTNDGHNFPSGSLGAQPQVWLNVVLSGPDSKGKSERKWETGYVDDVGDIADLHSQQVLDGDLPHDDQLFNLQSKFLTTNVKGTDREMYLPVNIDVDQIPFIRPAGVPSTVLNHPPFIRMEQHSIPPLMTKEAPYKIPSSALDEPGSYQLTVRLRSRAEPIYFMKFVGSTADMKTKMNDRMVDIHEYTVEFEVAR